MSADEQLSKGRWVRASKEEADRNDPTYPKSVRRDQYIKGGSERD
jgi:hypothetical protein